MASKDAVEPRRLSLEEAAALQGKCGNCLRVKSTVHCVECALEYCETCSVSVHQNTSLDQAQHTLQPLVSDHAVFEEDEEGFGFSKSLLAAKGTRASEVPSNASLSLVDRINAANRHLPDGFQIGLPKNGTEYEGVVKVCTLSPDFEMEAKCLRTTNRTTVFELLQVPFHEPTRERRRRRRRIEEEQKRGGGGGEEDEKRGKVAKESTR